MLGASVSVFLYSFSAAQNDIVLIQHDGLSGRGGALGLVKFQPEAILARRVDGGGLFDLMIPRPGRDPQRLGQFGNGDPVDLICIDDAVKQARFRADCDRIFLHIFGTDIDRRAHGKAKALPLADGVPDRAAVSPHFTAALVEEVSVRVMLAREVLHELLIVAIRHETNVLTVMLAGIDEMLPFGDLTHLRFVQRTQRQTHMSQLLLRQIVKDIALIFSFVQALFQKPAAGGFVLLDAGIVARDHILHPVRLGPREKMIEFHIFVAVDAGVGRTARFIDPDEFFDDLFPEIGGEIQHLIGDIHRERYLGGVLDVPLRAAGVESRLTQRFVAGEPHGDAGAVVAVLLHQPCRHRAVHAAAHRDQRPGARCILYICHFVPHVITYQNSRYILPHVLSLVKTQKIPPPRAAGRFSRWGSAR